jgi:drug/metabolite transporter (DMT)-like permease
MMHSELPERPFCWAYLFRLSKIGTAPLTIALAAVVLGEPLSLKLLCGVALMVARC